MLPFVLTHPGLVILRRHSITTDLWRMHTLDSTEEDFINEMVFNYGGIGGLAGQLMWRKMWGEALERKYPLLLLLAEGSLRISSFDRWILGRVRGESASDRLSLLPPPFGLDKVSRDTDKTNLITLYTEEYPLLLDNIANVLKDLKKSEDRVKLSVIADEHSVDEAGQILSENSVDHISNTITPKNTQEIRDAFNKSDIFLFIEDPAYPEESLPLYYAASTASISVVTDTRAHLHLPDGIFPRYQFIDRKKGLLNLLQDLLKNTQRVEILKENTFKWYKKTSKSAEEKKINPHFVKEILRAAGEAISTKSSWSYPVDYPSHLYDYRSRLEKSIRKNLTDFPESNRIEEAIKYIIS